MQMNPTRLRRTVQDERHDDAMAAARAGVEYALAKLVEDRDWRALANTTTIETDNLIVLEDQGNVLGWIRTEGGAWSGFRLRFNYQDGDGGEDGLQQPTRVIPTEAISYNNLEGASPFPVPLGTGSGFAYTGQTGFLVPEHSVALLVEGFTSPGLQPQVDAGSRYDEGRGESIVRRLEGIYQVVGFSGGHADGAVLQAGGNSHFLLGSGATGVGHPDDFQGFLRLTASAQTATMRTKGAATINTAPNKSSLFNFYPDMNSVVRSGLPTFSPRTKAGQTFSSDDEPSDAVLMDIAWDKVAVSEQEDRLFLPAGFTPLPMATPTQATRTASNTSRCHSRSTEGALSLARLQPRPRSPPSSLKWLS